MNSEDIRSKLTQVFQFLQALDQIKNPVEKDVERQLWNQWLFKLPEHECIDIAANYVKVEEAGDTTESSTVTNENYILKVTRPKNLPIPEPNEEIAPWLDPVWENCDRPVSVHQIIEIDDDGTEIPVNLEDDEGRLYLYEAWLSERE